MHDCRCRRVFLLLVVAGVIYFVFRLTAPMTEEGEKFLGKLGSGSTEAAYGMASATLRSSQTEDDFARTVKAYGLDGFESASWSSRNITNDRGTLEGTARTKSGGSVPLTIEMIKEDGTWKVLSIKGPQAGASTGPIIEEEPAATAKPALPNTGDRIDACHWLRWYRSMMPFKRSHSTRFMPVWQRCGRNKPPRPNCWRVSSHSLTRTRHLPDQAA